MEKKNLLYYMGCYKKIPFYKLDLEVEMSWLFEINLKNYMSVSAEIKNRLYHLFYIYGTEKYDKKNIIYCKWCDKLHYLIEKEIYHREQETNKELPYELEQNTYLFIKHIFLKDNDCYRQLDKKIRLFFLNIN